MTPTTPTIDPLPLLLGDLHLTADRHDRLTLLLVVARCRGCRLPHVHEWAGGLADPPTPRWAHCPRGPLHGRQYLVAPRPSAHNRRAVDLLAELERRPRRRRAYLAELRRARIDAAVAEVLAQAAKP